MNLVEGIQEEMKRCRELREIYDDIGPAGAFGKMVIDQSLDEAEAALASGDVVRMLRAHADLKQRE